MRSLSSKAEGSLCFPKVIRAVESSCPQLPPASLLLSAQPFVGVETELSAFFFPPFPPSFVGKFEIAPYLTRSVLSTRGELCFCFSISSHTQVRKVRNMCVYSPRSEAWYQHRHKGPVAGCRIGGGWAAWSCWILGVHYVFMFSLRCSVLSPGQLGHIFNGPFGRKTV